MEDWGTRVDASSDTHGPACFGSFELDVPQQAHNEGDAMLRDLRDPDEFHTRVPTDWTGQRDEHGLPYTFGRHGIML